MHPPVGGHFGERPQSGRKLVACPQRRAVLVEVAVAVAFGLAIDEHRLLKLGAIDPTLERNLEAIETLRDSDAAAHSREDRQVREISLNVRAAGDIGTEDETTFEIKTSETGNVDAPIDLPVRRRPVESMGGIEINIAAAQIPRELVARPIGAHQELRRIEIEP